MRNKKLLFISGTRADFGKLKSLIIGVEQSPLFDAFLFITGMHMQAKYGMTVKEVEDTGFQSIYKYINQNQNDTMDNVLAKTILGFSDYVKEIKPDLIIVHGDRVEALAGTIVGALNNILVGHIEGGEVSGTIDELIRHSISKMAHIHFVCSEDAKRRLIQLGEKESSLFVIGSPDIDLMVSPDLPSIRVTKEYYEVPFENYNIFMYHPVTTEIELLPDKIKNIVDALLESKDNYIVIYPNNDHGSQIILDELSRLNKNRRFRIFPSIRFEYFLTFLKNMNAIIGNSSAGIREAPFYGLPSINLGTRQNCRSKAPSIINCDEQTQLILDEIKRLPKHNLSPTKEFGTGNSDRKFISLLHNPEMWNISKQKVFVDIKP